MPALVALEVSGLGWFCLCHGQRGAEQTGRIGQEPGKGRSLQGVGTQRQQPPLPAWAGGGGGVSAA